jgi:hypothetical protein
MLRLRGHTRYGDGELGRDRPSTQQPQDLITLVRRDALSKEGISAGADKFAEQMLRDDELVGLAAPEIQ